MTRPMLFWGALMIALATIGVVVFDPADAKFAALMFGVGVAIVVVAGLLALGGPRIGRRPAPLLSPAAATTGAGLVLASLGAVWGLWLVLIGAGITVAGAVGLVLERRELP